MKIRCSKPTPYLDDFDDSTFVISDGKSINEIELNSENLLLRGSSLRNVEWVIGVCVYAGHHTKIMLNTSKSRTK